MKLMWPQTFQFLEYQWSEGKFDTLGKLGFAHRAQGTPPSEVRGTGALMVGGGESETF